MVCAKLEQWVLRVERHRSQSPYSITWHCYTPNSMSSHCSTIDVVLWPSAPETPQSLRRFHGRVWTLARGLFYSDRHCINLEGPCWPLMTCHLTCATVKLFVGRLCDNFVPRMAVVLRHMRKMSEAQTWMVWKLARDWVNVFAWMEGMSESFARDCQVNVWMDTKSLSVTESSREWRGYQWSIRPWRDKNKCGPLSLKIHTEDGLGWSWFLYFKGSFSKIYVLVSDLKSIRSSAHFAWTVSRLKEDEVALQSA